MQFDISRIISILWVLLNLAILLRAYFVKRKLHWEELQNGYKKLRFWMNILGASLVGMHVIAFMVLILENRLFAGVSMIFFGSLASLAVYFITTFKHE